MAIKAVLKISDDLVICKACGTQYPETDKSKKDSCKICDVSEALTVSACRETFDV